MLSNNLNDALLRELSENDFDLESLQLTQQAYPIVFQSSLLLCHQDLFTCPICQMVMNCPCVVPGCLHRFCKGCLQKWTKLGAQCPICRHQMTDLIDSSGNIRIDLIDYNMQFLLWQLPITCPNNLIDPQIKCSWTGNISQAPLHLKYGCQAKKVKCPNYGCDKQVFPNQLENHLSICSMRMEKCTQYCGKMIPVGQMMDHILNECRHTYVECKLCNCFILRMVEEPHIAVCRKDNPNEIKECDQSFWGCKFQGNIEELDQHHQICQLVFRTCKLCLQLITLKQSHTCQPENLENTLKNFARLVVDDDQNVNKKDESVLKNISKKIIQLSVTLETQKQQTLEKFSVFGPITNFKEYLDLKQGQKKILIKYSDRWFSQGCYEILNYLNQAFKLNFSHQILKTNKEQQQQSLYLEGFPYKEEKKIQDSLKTLKIEQVKLQGSSTDWSKGKMKFNFLLVFSQDISIEEVNKLLQQKFQLSSAAIILQPYSYYVQTTQKSSPYQKYDLDPYGDNSD